MDESRLHELSRKVGGRFRLAALIQKRLLELNRGHRPLVDRHHRNPLYTVLQEIEEDKLSLRAPEEDIGGQSAPAPPLGPPPGEGGEV